MAKAPVKPGVNGEAPVKTSRMVKGKAPVKTRMVVKFKAPVQTSTVVEAPVQTSTVVEAPVQTSTQSSSIMKKDHYCVLCGEMYSAKVGFNRHHF